MQLIKPTIQPWLWTALSLETRRLIDDVDFKVRASFHLQEIRSRAVKRLKSSPKPLRLKIFCEDETNRLMHNDLVKSHEASRFTEYFIEQVTGAIAGQKDKNGLRQFLCIGGREYQRRGCAPEPAWTKYAYNLLNANTASRTMLRRWLQLQRSTFGELPSELEDILQPKCQTQS